MKHFFPILLMFSSFTLLGQNYQIEIQNKDNSQWVSDISAVRSILFPGDQMQVNLRSGQVKSIAKTEIRKVIFKVATGTQVVKESKMLVFPTITRDYIQIMNSEDTISTLQIFGVDGKVVSAKAITPGLNVLNLSLLNSGIYILRSGEDTFKVIKE